MNKLWKYITLIFLLILVLGVFTIFSFKTYNKYKIWNLHKDYFKENSSNQKIEDWMSLRLIEKKFHIDSKEILNLSLSFYEKRKSLEAICIENDLDCIEIIKRLNEK